MCRLRTALTLFAFSLLGLAAQGKPPLDPHCHDFDFWKGSWDVFTNDQLVGHNRIEAILDGAVLQEHWEGKKGGGGSSFNYYNPQAKRWEQFWVDNQGTPLPLLVGGLKDGKMVLEGVQINQEQKITHRITWSANADGSVRQLWESSKDGGVTWTVAFDGLYKKAK